DRVEASTSQLDQIWSAGRLARDPGACSFLLRLPRPAGYRLSNTSATDDFPPLRFDSLQSGHTDSGVDLADTKTAKAFVGATPAGNSDRALRFRRDHPTRRFSRIAKPDVRTARRSRLSSHSLRTEFECFDF